METKVTVKHFDLEASVKLGADADLMDVIKSVHGISIMCGWHQLQWEKCIIRLAEQYKNIEE
jgi:hypothetical protein